MSRIIKFKGWIPEVKKWADTIEIYQDGSFNLGLETEEGLVNGYDGILIQYTGLCDKNGKEIYEGDIVKYYGQKFYQNYGYHPLIKITWQQKTAKFVWEGRDRLFGFNPGTTRLMEVVGNIYEHKHLLGAAE